jgi:hypothetical protein
VFILIGVVIFFPGDSLGDENHLEQKLRGNIIWGLNIHGLGDYIEGVENVVEVLVINLTVERRHICHMVIELLNKVKRIRQGLDYPPLDIFQLLLLAIKRLDTSLALIAIGHALVFCRGVLIG